MKLTLGLFEINVVNHKKEIKKLLLDGRKIGAIKHVRDLKGWDLKRSKYYVDDIQRKLEGDGNDCHRNQI